MSRLAVGVLIAALAVGARAGADSWVRFVHLKQVLGPVEIDLLRGNGFEPARISMPISEGVRLRTSPEGRTEVLFENGSTLRLSPNTEVFFSKLMLLSSGYRASAVDLTQGAVRFKYRKNGEDHFYLAFSGGEIQMDGDAEFFLQSDGPQGKVTVDRGQIKLLRNGQQLVVRKNETQNFESSSKELAATR